MRSLFSLLALAGTASAQFDLGPLQGATPGEFFGNAFTAVGDLDGDGHDDFLVGGGAGWTTYSGDTLTPIYTIASAVAAGGASADSLGDINLDGVPDIVIGDLFANTPQGGGAVRVIDGATGLAAYSPPQNALLGPVGGLFGFAVTGLGGDVDGDGIPDFAASDLAGMNGAGSVQVHSGVDGSLLSVVSQGGPGSNFGRDLDRAGGDVNGNGTPDFIVGALGNGVDQLGRVHVFDGDGTWLRVHVGTVQPDGNGSLLGYSVAGLGDINGDDRADYAAGAPNTGGTGQFHGALQAFDGASGALLFTDIGANPSDRYGFAVARAGDLDADGLFDVAASSQNGGYVRAHSGRFCSTTPLYTVSGDPNETFGWLALGSLGDLNDDGLDELGVGAPDSTNGTLHLYAALDTSPSLSAWPAQLSLSCGGRQNLLLDAGPSKAGLLHWVFGSLATAPPGLGIPYPDGSVFGLAINNAYYTSTINNPNGGPKQGFLGGLDGDGRAQAAFVIPAGADPTLSGLVLYHQYGVFDASAPQTGNPLDGWSAASAITSVTLIP